METIQLRPQLEDRFSWRDLMQFIGPGILISIAYVDPANFLVDIQAGATLNYSLIWLLVVSSGLGLLLQLLCVRLGLSTGLDLAQACRLEYGSRSRTTIGLWLLTEVTIICSDIPEVIGSAFALEMLWGVPLWAGVLLTSASTMALLALQRYGMRKIEALVAVLVGLMGVCFVVEATMADVSVASSDCPDDWCAQFPDEDECPADYCGSLLGGFVPRINSDGIAIAVGLIGAIVMPHNLYLHSALVLDGRKLARPDHPLDRKWGIVYFSLEAALGLTASCVINLCVLVVAAATFYPSGANGYAVVDALEDATFDDARDFLANSLGDSAGDIFAVSLLASGLSSTVTGTLAGQYVMGGFLEIEMVPWKRNLLTRSVAIVPSFLVSVLAGKAGSTALIVISSIVLSFQLPFALLPLLRITSSSKVMGTAVNSRAFVAVAGGLSAVVVVANVYLIADTVLGAGDSGAAAQGLLAALAALVAVAYFGSLAYLLRRPLSLEAADGWRDVAARERRQREMREDLLSNPGEAIADGSL